MKRHAPDLVAFVAGLLFLTLAVGFLLDALDVWDADVSWVPPMVLVALGVAGVLSTTTRASRARERTPVVEEPAVEADAPSVGEHLA